MKSSAPWDLSVDNDEGVVVEGKEEKKKGKKEGNSKTSLAVVFAIFHAQANPFDRNCLPLPGLRIKGSKLSKQRYSPAENGSETQRKVIPCVHSQGEQVREARWLNESSLIAEYPSTRLFCPL